MEKSINIFSNSLLNNQIVNLDIKKLLLIQLLTFWNVWYWYIHRIFDRSDEPLGILSLIVAMLFIGNIDLNMIVEKKHLRNCIVILCLYILTYKFTPDMVHAILGVISLGYTFYISKDKISPAIIGLFFMSLPIVASMQFYLGYPLRALSSYFMVILLKLNGIFVTQDGTCLNFNQSTICVDTPCSGINMLWFSTFFTLFICCLYKLNLTNTVKVLTMSIITIIIANIMRSTSLFYTESGIVNLPHFVHQGVGVVTFILSMSAIIIYANISEKKCKI